MSQPPSFDRNTRIVATPAHLACSLADESVILNLDNGIYYGLNSVGSHVWSLLKGGVTLGELLSSMLDQYEVDEDRLEADVRRLLSQLHQQGLIRIGGSE